MAILDSTLLLEKIKQSFYYKDGNLHWINSSKGTKKDAIAGWKSKFCIQIELHQKNYKAHRLIFLLHHGYLPTIIDHIDGNPHNNKIENLREATQAQNLMNAKLRINNTSGHKGVSYIKKIKKWCAQADFDKKHYYLGVFDTKEEAINAATEFRKQHFKNFYRAS
ncbi:MAG: HNH endonuclease signature motif containing protein [Gammaproteobacteria bacterium]